MRLFEIIQLAAIGLAVFLPVALGRRLRRGRMAVLLLVAMVAQWVWEGLRWQLLPLDVATLMLAAGDALWDERRVRGFHRFRRGALGIVGLLAVAALPVALPVPVIPAPTGPFLVGTQTFELVDAERDEIYGLAEPDPDAVDAGTEDDTTPPPEPRHIAVQIWYPTESEGEPGVWDPDWDRIRPAVADALGIPGFALGHLADVPGHSIVDAPPLTGRFPVVLVSHGWKGLRTISLEQIEALAARGFIVIAPDHTYGAVATVLPDSDEVVRWDPRALPEGDDVDPEDYAAAAQTLVEVFADDLALILDTLEQGSLGAFGTVADHADLEAIGAMGHSAGGGAAVRLCLSDDRCRAVLGLDAWVEPIPDRLVARELQIPSLFMRSDGWRGTPNDRRLQGLAERSPSHSYWIGIEGAGHADFVLLNRLSPFGERLGWKGDIAADRVGTIVDSYTIAFFERYLLNVGGAELETAPPPEVSLEVFE